MHRSSKSSLSQYNSTDLFPARIGESLDFIKYVYEVDARRVLDNTINNHGKELINFLLETK